MPNNNKENISDIAGLIDSYWKFDNNQIPQSSWHEKQALLEKVRNIIEKEQNKVLSESQVKMVVQWLKRKVSGVGAIEFKDEFCKNKLVLESDSSEAISTPDVKQLLMDLMEKMKERNVYLESEKKEEGHSFNPRERNGELLIWMRDLNELLNTVYPKPPTKKDILNSILSQITPLEQEKSNNRLQVAAVLDDLIKANGGKEAFARKMKKSPSEITKWVSGTQNFTMDTLTNITHHLGVSLSQFMKLVQQHGRK